LAPCRRTCCADSGRQARSASRLLLGCQALVACRESPDLCVSQRLIWCPPDRPAPIGRRTGASGSTATPTKPSAQSPVPSATTTRNARGNVHDRRSSAPARASRDSACRRSAGQYPRQGPGTASSARGGQTTRRGGRASLTDRAMSRRRTVGRPRSSVPTRTMVPRLGLDAFRRGG
jgi:hypothetical protein